MKDTLFLLLGLFLYSCNCFTVDCANGTTVLIAYHDVNGNNLLFGDSKKYKLEDISITTIDENNITNAADLNNTISNEWLFVQLDTPVKKMFFTVKGVVKDSFDLGFQDIESECCSNVFSLNSVTKNNLTIDFEPGIIITE